MVEVQDFDLLALAGTPDLKSGDYVPNETVKSYGPLDEKAILESCLFLKESYQSATLSEPEWYSGLTLVSRFANPQAAAIEFSKGHPKFTEKETLLKAEHAAKSPGPWTCEKIRQVWQAPKCQDCAFNGKVKTPLQIRAPEFIKTRDTGFHTVIYNDNGVPTKWLPNYTDLLKFFNEQHDYIATDDGRVFVWRDFFWQQMPESRIFNFAQEHFEPKPRAAMCREFNELILRTNLVRSDWFETSTLKKLNMRNGVLDIEKLTLLPHAKEYGFKSIIDYDYDEAALVTPVRFLQFMDEITAGDKDVQRVLLQFMGYALSNDVVWEHKALLLYGTTCNGKSVFVNILKMLVGKGYYSSVSFADLNKDTDRRMLEAKLFNISEEASSEDFAKSSSFKKLSAGDTITAKHLYVDSYEIDNKAKIIIVCNDPPDIKESIEAVIRRLIVVPFNVDFRGREDKFLIDKIRLERSAILRLCLEAYREMKAAGGIANAEAISEETLSLKENSDIFSMWVKDTLRLVDAESGTKIKTGDLYQTYKLHMENYGIKKPFDLMMFYKHLYKKFPAFELRKMKSGPFRYLRGVVCQNDSQPM